MFNFENFYETFENCKANSITFFTLNSSFLVHILKETFRFKKVATPKES